MAAFAPEGQIENWKARSDVLYHIAAYHYFSRDTMETAIDVINLDAGDIQFYNRTMDMTCGLRTDHELADYLHSNRINFSTDNIKTYRDHLIAHIHQYNVAVNRRQRFFMLNLHEDEQLLCVALGEAIQSGPDRFEDHLDDFILSDATDGMVVPRLEKEKILQEKEVAGKIEQCTKATDEKSVGDRDLAVKLPVSTRVGTFQED